ncbi:MAG: hypothetical protein K8T20_11430 [Planctomycetes bacterium]|nr:hypothetical protein [Planctomycetota bacterium]
MSHPTDARREALRRIAAWYDSNGFRTRTNDGLHSHFALDYLGGHLWPHLMVWEEQTLVRVIEVETEESLGALAIERWRANSGAGVPLHVYVPWSAFERAFQLRSDAHLAGVKLLTYREEEQISAWTTSGRIHERA